MTLGQIVLARVILNHLIDGGNETFIMLYELFVRKDENLTLRDLEAVLAKLIKSGEIRNFTFTPANGLMTEYYEATSTT